MRHPWKWKRACGQNRGFVPFREGRETCSNFFNYAMMLGNGADREKEGNMETLLMSIQKDITQYAGMMSMIFPADVDVADQNLIRVAGTGRFARRIGSSLHSGRVSARVLETGRPIFIKDPGMEPLCQNCLNLSVCKDQCELRVPIKLDMEVIGTLGIASSSPEQYTEIIGRYEQMFVFANHMASLIALKAREVQDQKIRSYDRRVQDQLGNLLMDGVLLLDENNQILYMNQRSEKILGNTLAQLQYLRKIRQLSVQEKTGGDENATVFEIKIRDKRHDLSGKCRQIKGVEDDEIVRVFVFSDIRSRDEAAQQPQAQDKYTFDYLLGASAPWAQAVEACRESSYNTNCILLSGEPGTGKELYAHAIHNESVRRNNRFLRLGRDADVDEMFQKMFPDTENVSGDGLIIRNEMIDGCTFFVDGVETLSPRNQDILLLIIRSSQLNNTKVICSTSANLRRMAQMGDFRYDLLYILEMYTVEIPPLRARGQDVLLFVERHLERYNKLTGKNLTISKQLKEMFLNYSWKGNIREVENVISYIVENSDDDAEVLTPENLPQLILERLRDDKKNAYNLENAEKELIIKALNDFGNNARSKSLVAKELGISSATLYRKLKQYRIQQNMLFE